MKIARKSNSKSSQLEHVTQEMYKQNLELSERNKTLTLLRQIDEVVLSSTTEVSKAAQTIATLLTQEQDFSLAAIFVVDKTKSHALVTGLAAQAKSSHDTDEALQTKFRSLSLHHSPHNALSYAVSTKKIQTASNFTNLSSSIDETTNTHLKEGLNTKSLFVCPLFTGAGLIGILVLGTPLVKNELSSYLHNLVDRLTGTISIAVENYLLYGELQEATARLRVQNKKLKELDQTKDEFISMASHQLRTPLTTVKGYVSMILDGDAGTIKKEQKDLLQRAFDGADRMVFLIADLLNVSRLQSGKFVIDNKPTDLVKVVETEVSQLQESAANHELKLTFHKPEKFPIVNLDETKVRQVIMNFMDNAIYYTPKGGSVDVALQATDKEITYTVTDTGLGVPKAEQHKLFAKFYRAGNARKMRPDGTGLGLFMAKKVIIAQGGAIIFKSTEGKGSVFGFSFPRHAVEGKEQSAPKPELAKSKA